MSLFITSIISKVKVSNARNLSNSIYSIFAFKSYTTNTDDSQNSKNKKKIKVAVIGVPNAGKSTFINNLINHRVCPTSNKVHTTRRAHSAISTTDDSQIILFDTPGLVTEKEIKKYNLETTFITAYQKSIQNADLVAVIHDVSNSYTRNELHPTVLHSLQSYENIPSFLVLNKIDAIKSKRILLDLVQILTNKSLSGIKSKEKTRKQKEKEKNSPNDDDNKQILNVNKFKGDKKEKPAAGWSNFENVFMVSALTGDGLQDVMNYILTRAKPSKWEFSSDKYTDYSPEEIIVDSVRARLLDYLPQEIPYNLKSELEYYSIDKNVIYASVQVNCPSARIERLVCGELNGKLRQITERVTSDLVETFAKPVSLTISTAVIKCAEAKA